MTTFTEKLLDYTRRFNDRLPTLFSLPAGAEKRVVEAMLYSVTNGGKRLRPFLVCETAKIFSVSEDESFRTAAALEILHSYSLIHDDLPSMDNDDLRRGKPTCHKKFDEATAILAGDGLLTYAFELLSHPDTAKSAEIRCRLVSMLAKAAGAFDGMVAGQMLDLYSERSDADYHLEEIISHIEEMKTGRLIRFACEAGAALGNADLEETEALVVYSRKIGIAFQIADDILDVEGNPALVGKTLNKDAAQGKLTFVGLYGLEKSKQMADKLVKEAKESLALFGKKAQTLQQLADHIVNRKN